MEMTEQERDRKIIELKNEIKRLQNMEVKREVEIQRYDPDLDFEIACMNEADDGEFCLYEDVVKLFNELKQSQPTLHYGGKAWWTGEFKGRDGVRRIAHAQLVILENPKHSSDENLFKALLSDGDYWNVQREFLTPLPDGVEI